MRDPYLYEDVDVLINNAGIKDSELLKEAEANITSVILAGIYESKYEKFDIETLQDIHKTIFGHIYPWAGQFRTIQMIKSEEVLGGFSVEYSYPKEIKKHLKEIMAEIPKLKRTGENDNEIVFKLVRIIARIWHIHPFREGNTRTTMVFAVLLAKSLGFDVNHVLFKNNSAYVRNALVWCSQGIYSKYEYFEKIFFDAVLGQEAYNDKASEDTDKYNMIGSYNVKDYKEQPHIYVETK